MPPAVLHLTRLHPGDNIQVSKIRNWLRREYLSQLKSSQQNHIIHPYNNWSSIQTHMLGHGGLILKLNQYWAGLFLWTRHRFHVVEIFYQYVSLRFRRRGYAKIFFNTLCQYISNQPVFLYLQSTAEALPYYMHNHWRRTFTNNMTFRLNKSQFANPASRCPSGTVLAFSSRSFYDVRSNPGTDCQKIYFKIDLRQNGVMRFPYAYRSDNRDLRSMHESYLALLYDHKVITFDDGSMAEGKALHFFKNIDAIYRLNYVVISQIQMDDIKSDKIEIQQWLAAAMMQR